MPDLPVTIPSGSRVVVVVSKGPLDDETRAALERDNLHMPDVLGKTQGAALEALADIDLHPKVIYDYNDTIGKGSVMDQHPVAGKLISPNLESLLLISSGPALNTPVQVTLPDVVGLLADEAEEQLRGAGLSPQFVHAKSSTVEAGKVLAQIPDAASLVATPEVKSRVIWVIIALIMVVLAAIGYYVFSRNTVSAPPPVEQVVSQVLVPNLIGLSEEEAKVELQKVGLTLGAVTVAAAENTPHGAKPGTVVSTTPKEGEEIVAGSSVAIEIAADTEGVPSGEVLVPNLKGLDEVGVKKALKDTGLELSVVSGPSTSTDPGLVFLQSPLADTTVPTASVVVVVLSSGEPADTTKVTLPDVVNKPVAEATQVLQDLGVVVSLAAIGEDATGPVETQVPEAGKKVYKGGVVILRIKTPN